MYIGLIICIFHTLTVGAFQKLMFIMLLLSFCHWCLSQRLTECSTWLSSLNHSKRSSILPSSFFYWFLKRESWTPNYYLHTWIIFNQRHIHFQKYMWTFINEAIWSSLEPDCKWFMNAAQLDEPSRANLLFRFFFSFFFLWVE